MRVVTCNDKRMDDGRLFFLVGNIPGHFHSYDLRGFFSHFVEKGGFHCFHFRHRPEHLPTRDDQKGVGIGGTSNRADEQTTASQNSPKKGEVVGDAAYSSSFQGPLNRLPETRAGSSCCVVAVKRAMGEEFLQLYNGKNWTDSKGEILPSRVRLRRLNARPSDDSVELPLTRTQQLEMADLTSLPELHPPGLMPEGNVGTPLATFMALIKSCKLPSHVIRKLRLEFPKSRSTRRYGAVPMDYGPQRDGDILSQYEQRWSLKNVSGKEPVGATTSSSKKKGQKKKRKYEDDDRDCTSGDIADVVNADVRAVILSFLHFYLSYKVLVSAGG